MREVVQGTLEPDGTLVLDRRPNLSPGRVRVTVEAAAESPSPARFWAMMEQIWDDAKASGHRPCSPEEVEAERRAFREEWDERQDAMERIHLDGDRRRWTAEQPNKQAG